GVAELALEQLEVPVDVLCGGGVGHLRPNHEIAVRVADEGPAVDLERLLEALRAPFQLLRDAALDDGRGEGRTGRTYPLQPAEREPQHPGQHRDDDGVAA